MFIKRIADEKHPKAKQITLVMDNYNTHNASSFYETFKPKEAKKLWDRFEFVYTPKHVYQIDLKLLQAYRETK